MEDELGNHLPNKMIPRSFRRPLPVNEELREARKSPAYWWYRCLQANDEYEYCCRHEGKGEMASMYADFGNVFDLSFAQWWMRHGRKLFTEVKPFKETTVIDSLEKIANIRLSKNRLFLEIPLTIRKQTVFRQIGKILKAEYEGRVIDVMKASTARRKIIKNKMRMSTVEQLLNIKAVRDANPRMTLNEVGLAAGIVLDLNARVYEAMTEADERRRMTIAVGRLLRQAKNLINNAGMGKFPSLLKPTAS
jgi:hypothetical protein